MWPFTSPFKRYAVRVVPRLDITAYQVASSQLLLMDLHYKISWGGGISQTEINTLRPLMEGYTIDKDKEE